MTQTMAALRFCPSKTRTGTFEKEMYELKSALHILPMQAIKKPEGSWVKQFAASGLRVRQSTIPWK